MRNTFFLSALTFVCFTTLHAQDGQTETTWKEPSKESQAYHEYRTRNTRPPYGLAKVQALIRKAKTDEEDNVAIDKKSYQSLSLREKFTYHMIHAESYSQICDAFPPIEDEHKKIFGQLPDTYEEYTWSERQLDFFKTNRDSVMALVQESVTRSKRMGLNLKKAIIEINGTEMIPFIISTYKANKKDLDLLTMLMLLMKANKYEPFLKSASYRKLYGDDSDYDSHIDFNTANEALIIQRAEDFYHGLKK